jgi:hypothetical protein
MQGDVMDGASVSAMSVDRVKHLEMIQAIVTRMAGNSFLVKGWAVTIVAALIAVAAKEAEVRFALVALLPAFSFWGLDAYYLRYERLYRRLYDDVRVAPEERLAADAYSLATTPYVRECPSWFRTLRTAHVVALHGILIAALIAAVVSLVLARRHVLPGELGGYS